MESPTDDNKKNPFIIFVIGCPAAGKGTLCRQLQEEFQFKYFSIGEILRDYSTTEYSYALKQEIVDCVTAGTLVRDDIVTTIIEQRVDWSLEAGTRFVLVGGFPRTLNQGVEVEKLVGPPQLVLFFNCPRETAKQRFVARVLEKGGTRRRSADGEAAFEKRYKDFEDRNQFIAYHYRRKGILVEVDTSPDTATSYRALYKSLLEQPEWRAMLFSQRFPGAS